MKILESLAEITRHNDTELLESSLAKTLFDLFEATEVSFFRIHKDARSIFSLNRVNSQGVQHITDRKLLDQGVEPFTPLFEQVMKSSKTLKQTIDNNKLEIWPLFLGSTIIGFLVLRFTADHPSNDSLIAGFLQVYKNYHTLLVDNQHDNLTGLLNRKTFEERLYHFMDLQLRYTDSDEPEGSFRNVPEDNWGFWLGIFDIDNFKQINDTFGHVYGDDVLITISTIIKQSFRPQDIKLRYGGEEFIVVIRAANKDDAILVFERFRQDVASHHFGLAGSITISLGLIQIEQNDVISTVVGRADQALYYSKKTGKNRLSVYEDLVEQGILENTTQMGNVTLF